VARFVATNRSYKIVGRIGSDEGAKNSRLRDLRPEVLQADKRLGLEGQCIAFEKTADDARQCDHYADF
jgi:hypothetical protein